MDLPRIVTVVSLLLPAIQAATVPVDQTLMFKEIDSLLRRCPCVPINTCYSQGVSLNEQNFLNTNFECEDHTYNHCCGPYYQTVGNEDFYFDENGFDRQGAWRKPPDLMSSNIMIMLPPEPTTESPESLTKVHLVYPETTAKPTTESIEETTPEVTTQEPFKDYVETTPMDEDTTTELVTTTTPSTTSEPSSTSNRTTLSPQEQRLARLQNRPPYPTRVRSTRLSTTTTTTSTTTTTEASTTPRFSTIKPVFHPNSRHRQAMNKLRLFVKTSTTPSSAEYDDDYDDDEDDDEDDGGTRIRDTNTAEEDEGEDEL
ncbi:cell wall protein DAN4 [Aedes aegypti]|uniref:Uncharacterized protein n=1 Tax=Aedes aegypti TaxID=7159 RepID=A0A1S4FBA7_AEDAE|nr:cell wall protein DAN4 [Aedes aegypti]